MQARRPCKHAASTPPTSAKNNFRLATDWQHFTEAVAASSHVINGASNPCSTITHPCKHTCKHSVYHCTAMPCRAYKFKDLVSLVIRHYDAQPITEVSWGIVTREEGGYAWHTLCSLDTKLLRTLSDPSNPQTYTPNPHKHISVTAPPCCHHQHQERRSLQHN